MATTRTDPTLINAIELADRMGVSTGTVHRWVRAGAIEHVETPSGRLRFDAAIVPLRGSRLTP